MNDDDDDDDDEMYLYTHSHKWDMKGFNIIFIFDPVFAGSKLQM